MKNLFGKTILSLILASRVFLTQAADRYWVHQPVYQNFFSTAGEIADWKLVEDDGAGGFSLSASGTGILKMDDAAGSFANRLFNKNGASTRLLPFDVVNGRVELLVKSITGGNQRIFLQAEEFTGSGVYLGQVNILPARSATGFFSVNLSTITWDPSTVQVRFIIGGENYSGQQGTVEFGYFSYSNTNGNWSNPANWSAISGGAGGASVPGPADNAIFNGSGNTNGSCLLDIAANVSSLQVLSGYSGNISLQGFQMTVGAGGAVIAGGGITGGSQNIQINGNVSISGGAFTNPSGNTYVTGDVAITGGVLNFGTGTVIFNGTADQQFLASVITPINSLVVDKPTSAINFGSDILISGTLTLNHGILNMNGNTIRLGTSGSNIGTLIVGNAEINGNFARWLSSSATGDIIFPLGNASVTSNLTLTVVTPPSVASVVTASYIDSTPGFSAANFFDGSSLISQRSLANWTVQTAGLSGGSYSLSVANNHLGVISGLSDLHLTLANGVVGSHLAASGTLTAPVVHRTGLTAANLGQTFYASLNTVILPVTWQDFSVIQQGRAYIWNWSLSQQENVAFYFPQYSLDGVHFISAGKLAPAYGVDTYTFTAPISETGSIFFRVQELDKDGKAAFSPIKVITSNNLVEFACYPNPIRDMLIVHWPFLDAAVIYTTITSSEGKLILMREDSYSPSIPINVAGLAAGSYFVRCSDNRQHKSNSRMVIKLAN